MTNIDYENYIAHKKGDTLKGTQYTLLSISFLYEKVVEQDCIIPGKKRLLLNDCFSNSL
jgi:hypothetical protein